MFGNIDMTMHPFFYERSVRQGLFFDVKFNKNKHHKKILLSHHSIHDI